MEYSQENITEANIIAYLNGDDLTDAVVAELSSWLEIPENRKEAQRIYKAWELSALAGKQIVDAEAAFRNIKKNTGIGKARSLPTLKWWYAAAASILIIIAFVWQLQPDEKTIRIASGGNSLQDTLPDLSIVTLNTNSSILYQPALFTEGNESRIVNLTGEGYFEVTHDPKKPFVVKANDIQVTVLGTKFLIRTFTDKSSEVIVTEGKVKVDHLKTGRSYILEANESIDLASSERPDVKTSDQNKLYWKTGVFTFEGTPVREVIKTLEAEFDVTISVEKEQLLDCNISVTLKKKSIDTIMEVISSTFGWTVEKNGNEIYLKGNGCQ